MTDRDDEVPSSFPGLVMGSMFFLFLIYLIISRSAILIKSLSEKISFDKFFKLIKKYK